MVKQLAAWGINVVGFHSELDNRQKEQAVAAFRGDGRAKAGVRIQKEVEGGVSRLPADLAGLIACLKRDRDAAAG